MINIILFLWQLPQNLIALCLIKFLGCIYQIHLIGENTYFYWFANKYHLCFSLGNYIVFCGDYPEEEKIKDKLKLCRYSLYLGWSYIPIGLTKIFFNKILKFLFTIRLS
jgi:hypothetical protein